MDDSVKITDELIAQAKQVVENPAFKMAFVALEESAWQKFKASQGRDSEAREKIYWFLKALEEFRGQLEIYLSEELVEKSKEKTKNEKFLENFDFA